MQACEAICEGLKRYPWISGKPDLRIPGVMILRFPLQAWMYRHGTLPAAARSAQMLSCRLILAVLALCFGALNVALDMPIRGIPRGHAWSQESDSSSASETAR